MDLELKQIEPKPCSTPSDFNSQSFCEGFPISVRPLENKGSYPLSGPTWQDKFGKGQRSSYESTLYHLVPVKSDEKGRLKFDVKLFFLKNNFTNKNDARNPFYLTFSVFDGTRAPLKNLSGPDFGKTEMICIANVYARKKCDDTKEEKEAKKILAGINTAQCDLDEAFLSV